MGMLGVIHVLPLVKVFFVVEFIGAFSTFLDVQMTLVADFYGVIYGLEEAQKLSLTNVLMECDSVLVCAAFTARTNVSWMFCNQ